MSPSQPLSDSEARPTLIAGGCARVGTFMGVVQRCGEPEESAWHQPGDWYHHDFYAQPEDAEGWRRMFMEHGWSIEMRDGGKFDPFAVLAEVARA